METSRLPLELLEQKFTEINPPMSRREATIEATRCLYCYDAPCIAACPTSIDVPTFIRKIATENVTGAAVTILEANLMGATCSRVCPVEELCEGACVLGSDHKPIEIGRLQRYATDHLYQKGVMPFSPAPANDKKVAIVGAGPAGLTCAGELAKLGYETTVFEKNRLPGGLSTYGIVVMREPIQVALEEVDFVKRLGVDIKTGVEVGSDVRTADLIANYDAVFIAAGLGHVPDLGVPGEELDGVTEALSFIAETKLAERDGLERLASIPIGRQVVVIGAGNTAIDAATIAKRLGSERVVIVYRRGEQEMPAYEFEYTFIKNEGVEFRFLSQPVEILGTKGHVTGLRCIKMELTEAESDGRRGSRPLSGSEFVLPCDQVIKAIGQEKHLELYRSFGLAVERGYVKVDNRFRTSNPKVFAGGDCIRATGEAMTVTATEDGKGAAKSIHSWLESTTAE
jgi:glutamate synthase (NADPH/NADH) small chain